MKLLNRGNLIAGIVALLLGLALLLTAALLPRPLQNQFQAERWAGDSGGRFAQFDCILAPGKELEPSAIYGFRETALNKLAASDDGLPADGSAICDAWSAGGTLKITGPRGSFDVSALAVGGRFFDFHPQSLLSGVFLAESDLQKDRVVLEIAGKTEVKLGKRTVKKSKANPNGGMIDRAVSVHVSNVNPVPAAAEAKAAKAE